MTGAEVSLNIVEVRKPEVDARLIADIHDGLEETSSYPQGFVEAIDTTIFTADNGRGTDLWKTDGTAAGTVLVKDINTLVDPTYNFPMSSNPWYFIEVGGTVYFLADDGVLYASGRRTC